MKKIKKQKFPGRIFILGCGSIGRTCVPIIFQKMDITPERVTVMDMNPGVKSSIAKYIPRGLKFIHTQLTRDNYTKLLNEHMTPGDIFLDCAWNVDTIEMLAYCRDHNILYLNTSFEQWDPFDPATHKHPGDYTLYARHKQLREYKRAAPHKSTAIIDHGANPGFVSHLVKVALIDIAKSRGHKLRPTPVTNHDFAKLAKRIGLRTIHISETDTQCPERAGRTRSCGQPPNGSGSIDINRRIMKKSNTPGVVSMYDQLREHVNSGVFVNTWSVTGFHEEGVSPAELGWGTHETRLPPGAKYPEPGANQIFLASRGIDSFMNTWVHSGAITGMIIRHGEAFSISDRLSLNKKRVTPGGDVRRKCIYRPTVHYVYLPCELAMLSLDKMRANKYREPSREHILYSEIHSGRDELGVTLIGKFGVWWTGSLLDISRARELVPDSEINATSVQVASSLIAAMIYAIRHPNSGILLPDDLPYKQILAHCREYLKPMISRSLNADIDPPVLKLVKRDSRFQTLRSYNI